MTESLLLAVAAFFAGAVNAIAGGGSFITFPALMFVGVPPIIANATNAAVVLPGYLGGAIGFRKDLGEINRSRLIQFIAVALLGGFGGALLLLVTTSETFETLIPWLLFSATIIFAIGENVRRWAEKQSNFPKIPETLSLCVVSAYGGYFNGGLGIMLLALFSLNGKYNLNAMNGLKSLLSVPISAIAVTTYAVAGLIDWSLAAMMMVTATFGGYVGAKLARILPRKAIKVSIVVIGITMSAVFYWKGI